MPITDTFGPPAYVFTFLDQLAQALPRGVPKQDGIRIIAAVIGRAGIYEAALQEALVTILEEEDRFPSAATIIKHAKRRAPPPLVDEATRGADLEAATREQVRIERLWLERFRQRDDQYPIRVASKRIASLEAWLDRRERGWNHRDTLKIGGGPHEQGLPNRASVAAYTGDESYLTDYGNRDPRVVAHTLSKDVLRKARP